MIKIPQCWLFLWPSEFIMLGRCVNEYIMTQMKTNTSDYLWINQVQSIISWYQFKFDLLHLLHLLFWTSCLFLVYRLSLMLLSWSVTSKRENSSQFCELKHIMFVEAYYHWTLFRFFWMVVDYNCRLGRAAELTYIVILSLGLSLCPLLCHDCDLMQYHDIS